MVLKHYTGRHTIRGYQTPIGWGFSDAWDSVSDAVSDSYDYVSDKAGSAIDLAEDAYSWSEKNVAKAGKLLAAGSMLAAGIATLNPALIAGGVAMGYDEAKQVANWVSNGSKGAPPKADNLAMILASANSSVINPVLKSRGYDFQVTKTGEPASTVVTESQLNTILPQNPEITKQVLLMAGYTEKSGAGLLLGLAAILPFLA